MFDKFYIYEFLISIGALASLVLLVDLCIIAFRDKNVFKNDLLLCVITYGILDIGKGFVSMITAISQRDVAGMATAFAEIAGGAMIAAVSRIIAKKE